MERPDRSKWTEILTYGATIEIDEGMIEDGTGSQWVVAGAVQPFFRYRKDGVWKSIRRLPSTGGGQTRALTRPRALHRCRSSRSRCASPDRTDARK